MISTADDLTEAQGLLNAIERRAIYAALAAAESVVTNIAAEVQPGAKSRLAGAREVLAALYALADRQGWKGRDRNNTKTAREGKE